MSRRTQGAVVTLVTALLAATPILASCAVPNETAGQPNPTFSTDVRGTPGMEPMLGMGKMPTTPPETGGAGPSGSTTPVGADAVNVDGFAFIPATLTVKAGTTVSWTNKDEDPHTVVAAGGAFRSQALGSGGTYSFTFPAAGTFDYVCSIHPFMHGSVVVTP